MAQVFVTIDRTRTERQTVMSFIVARVNRFTASNFVALAVTLMFAHAAVTARACNLSTMTDLLKKRDLITDILSVDFALLEKHLRVPPIDFAHLVEEQFAALGSTCPPVPAFAQINHIYHLSRADTSARIAPTRGVAEIISFRGEGLTNFFIQHILAAIAPAKNVAMVDLAYNEFTARTTGVAFKQLIQPLLRRGIVVVVFGNLNVVGCRGLFRRLFDLATQLASEADADESKLLNSMLLKLVWISRMDLLRGHWKGLLRDESRRPTEAEIKVLSLVVAVHMNFYDGWRPQSIATNGWSTTIGWSTNCKI
jgi:hypothetical protein